MAVVVAVHHGEPLGVGGGPPRGQIVDAAAPLEDEREGGERQGEHREEEEEGSRGEALVRGGGRRRRPAERAVARHWIDWIDEAQMRANKEEKKKTLINSD